MEQDAWLNDELLTEKDVGDGYKWFMRNEPRQKDSEILIEEETGWRYTHWNVGMVRNAKEEDKKRLLVFLDPIPHTIIDNGKPLQGWYKAKHEPPGVRPRPCFTDAILTQPYGGFCPVGCAFSLPGDAKVDTLFGPVEIQKVRVGDLVWGRYPEGVRLTRVLGTTRHLKPEGYVVIDFSDGRVLEATADHPIYVEGLGWTAAGSVALGARVESLPDKKAPQTVRALRGVPAGSNTQVLRPLSSSSPLRIDARKQERAHQAASLLFPVRNAPSASEREVLPEMQFAPTEGNRVQAGSRAVLLSEGNSEVARNAGAYASGLSEASRQSREGASQVCRVEAEAVGTSSGGQGGVLHEQAASVSPSRWEGSSDAFGVGMAYRVLDGRGGDRVGIRAEDFGAQRRNLSAGFLAPGAEDLRGSEGVFSPGAAGEDGAFPEGVSHRGLGSESSSGEGNPEVVGIREVPGALYVFDIQTESHNFYVNGLLVHNCYINHGYRGYRAQGLTTVPAGYGEEVRKQLKRMRTSAAGYFSSFTDPFLPLEEHYHNTRDGATAFADEGLPVFFLSRLQYPGWAYDLLKRNAYSYAQMSINTSDPDDWRRLSPNALPLPAMIDQVRALHEAGIYVSIQVNPIIAGVTLNEEIVTLIHQLAQAGADHLIFKFVEISYSSAPALVTIMKRRFGDNRGGVFASLFTCNIGSEKTIDEQYRLDALDLFARECKKAKVTMATCYEYRYERDGLGNIVNKTGVSVGSDYLTADQCHGHRVPMFSRPSAGASFVEVSDCPPSGCLTCADGNGGKPRCGNELFGQAKALRATDLRQPVYPEK